MYIYIVYNVKKIFIARERVQQQEAADDWKLSRSIKYNV